MNRDHLGDIKAIIGLGNPGKKFERTRHNIGFVIVDELANRHGATFDTKNGMEIAHAQIGDKPVLLVKPLTFMNNSGDIMPFLQKKGISVGQILVVHDELELPFGTIKLKVGGSAKGHNGLKSIIVRIGDAFARLRFGIGRPASREEVPDYVLAPFDEDTSEVSDAVQVAVEEILKSITQ